MLRVLIVEDHRNFRETFRSRLYEYSPSIVIEEAENGEEAWQKMKGTPSHLIWMDIRLPRLNSLQLTQRIKTNFPNIHIAILTSYDHPECRQAAFQYGADRFFVKDSFAWDEVEALVKSILPDMS
jgi:two-component system, response regulator YesN